MTILLVDDDAAGAQLLAEALRSAGDEWTVRHVPSGRKGMDESADPAVRCVLLDYRLPDHDGLACLRHIRQHRPELPVIMVTGAGSEHVAVEAMKLGAADYVVKHGTYVRAVPGIVREALGRRALTATAGTGYGSTIPATAPAILARFAAEGFIARSAAMQRVAGLLDRAAQSRATVLIEGESGTGKEVCARAIQRHGTRAAKAFVAQNCAAVPESLLESELFGHVRGAFTGADRGRPGLFEQADGGTLFLDEIGEASPAVQATLLRVLQEREIRPLGGTTARRIDVRLIAATNRDLRTEIDAGRFRLDLYYRLRVFPIVIPPLRDRPEDIAPMAETFLARLEHEEEKVLAGIAPEALRVLERYPWPGNVRELENEMHRLVLCAEPGERLSVQALAPWIAERLPVAATDGAPLRTLLREVETAIIQRRLREHGYRRAATARSLGITREALWAKLRQLGLAPPGPPHDE